MRGWVFLGLYLFSAYPAHALDLNQFATICRDGDPGITSVWLRSDAANIFASLLFNPNSATDIGNCHRKSTKTEKEATSEGTPCEFVHSGEFLTVTIQFPEKVKASIVSVSGTQLLSYANDYSPAFRSVNSQGQPIRIPDGRLIASCDIGSNGSYVLFESGEVWTLEEVPDR